MKVLITGASSGIGRDLARVLSKTYDEMVLVGRDKERLESLQKELTNAKIKIVSLDISNMDNCIQLFEDNKDMDLLINNAGFGDCGFFDETDLHKDFNMINTNIVGLHILTKLYLEEMKKKNSGHILNVASIAGFMPGPLMATYYATKNYVVRLSEAIRVELKKEKSKVKISILCPGPVNTKFNQRANVKFNLQGMESMKLAEYAVKHLNRFYIVPGLGVKITRFFSHIVSSNMMAKFCFNIQKKKIYKQVLTI
ncbi:MAG: SDR family NAD(P)-dependent oxidoreductase [Bacilli bacterium]|nr:SDR family NAD(P)-dependent oxidoreductase [Bacilli bacterium]